MSGQPGRCYAPYDRITLLNSVSDEELIDILEVAKCVLSGREREKTPPLDADTIALVEAQSTVLWFCDLETDYAERLRIKLAKVMDDYLEGHKLETITVSGNEWKTIVRDLEPLMEDPAYFEPGMREAVAEVIGYKLEKEDA